jgi:hypothetical protein
MVGRNATTETGAWPRFGGWLLGAFVCFQLAYLPVANVLKLVPLRKPVQRGELYDDVQIRRLPDDPPGPWLLETVGVVCDRWAELSGQTQGWSLFAPHFGRVASLPVVRLVWNDPAREVRLLGYFTPPDPTHVPPRPPEPRCRLYNYEYRLAVAGWTWDREPLDEQAAGLATLAVAQVRRQYRSMHAYLRWRLDQYRAAHPDEPPPDVLELRALQIMPPDPRTGTRGPARELPIASWEPATEPPPGCPPIRVFDPQTGKPAWLSAEGGA